MPTSAGINSLAHLRSLIAMVNRELASTFSSTELRSAWSQMLEILARGPTPELRECPTCNEAGIRAAVRCIHCWSALPPLAPAPMG